MLKAFVGVLNEQMLAKARLTESLTRHPVLIGTSRERAIMDLLKPFVSARFEVLSGSVVSANEAAQFDLMIADTETLPVPLQGEAFAIVLPAAVKAIIEVKSALARPVSVKNPQAKANGETLVDVLEQIGRRRIATTLASETFSALVSFGAPVKNSTLRTYLQGVLNLRQAAQAAVMASKRGTPEFKKAQQRTQRLHADHLPDLIVTVGGAIAYKYVVEIGPRFYRFFKPKKGYPALTVLLEEVVKRLGGDISRNQDPNTLKAYQDLLSFIGPSTDDDSALVPDLSI